METVDRILGALQESKSATEKRLDRFEGLVEQRFNRLDEQLDSLKSFKWKVIGGLIVVGFVIKAVVEIASALN